jgi:hypothetical protein
LPGLLGGLAAVAFTATQGVQLLGILVTVAIALAAGGVGGQVLAILGRRTDPYVDSEELIVESETASSMVE